MEQVKETLKQKTFKKIYKQLGGSIIDLEIDNEEIENAFDFATARYRQRAENATIERGIIYGFRAGTQEIDLSEYPEIRDIMFVHRSHFGTGIPGTDIAVDPFLLHYVNQISTFMHANNVFGSVSIIDFQYQFRELLEKVTAHKINFNWDRVRKKLTIFNRVNRDETYLIITEMYRSDEELLADELIYPWLYSYTVAKCKLMLGEARSMYQSLGGPQGGVTMNGSEMKQEAEALIEKLDDELKNLITSEEGYGMVMA